MNHSHKRQIVFAIRDFPLACGTHTDDDSSNNAFKNPRTSDVAVKNLKPEGTIVKQESADHDHDVAVHESNGVVSTLRHEEEIRNDTDHDHEVTVPEPNGVLTLGEEVEIRNSDHLSPREKVLEVLRFFKQVYKRLDREKEERRGGELFKATSRIDIKTLEFIEKMGKQVNSEKRIGSVPGIEIGDDFQYKTELRVVGLHSKTMCGIDYMKIGELRLATSIVASEGYGYNDKFGSGVMVYTGEGGNMISKEKKTEDQKLTKGNLALANSMRYKKEVRVIRGEERWDRKGKRYVYDGLYMVEEYWIEKDVRGKSVYKFKLCRIPGQFQLT
ncbi:YDG domain-containing protein [Cardamine amara subsp. amara]|uniref:YDG domain-containing protein n=1 Tax=Cardamine amara subsp. amara TaxID=228776 RepID=A0ABD1B4R9_CARAN